MKTLVMCMCVASILAGSGVESEIESLVASHPLVEDVYCLVADEQVLVAITTQPIFSRTERYRLVESIEQVVSENFGLIAEVSMDYDIIYQAIKVKKQQQVPINVVQELIQSSQRRRNYEDMRPYSRQEDGQSPIQNSNRVLDRWYYEWQYR